MLIFELPKKCSSGFLSIMPILGRGASGQKTKRRATGTTPITRLVRAGQFTTTRPTQTLLNRSTMPTPPKNRRRATSRYSPPPSLSFEGRYAPKVGDDAPAQTRPTGSLDFKQQGAPAADRMTRIGRSATGAIVGMRSHELGNGDQGRVAVPATSKPASSTAASTKAPKRQSTHRLLPFHCYVSVDTFASIHSRAAAVIGVMRTIEPRSK